MSELDKPFDRIGKQIILTVRPYMHNDYPFVFRGFKVNDSNEIGDLAKVGITCKTCDKDIWFQILAREFTKPFLLLSNIVIIYYTTHKEDCKK